MIVDVKLVKDILDNPVRFKEKVMLEVRSFQRLGYRVEIQYSSDYNALIIARDCDWVGNNS